METQASTLAETLVEYGWRILDKSELPVWWADEIWEIESTWSPLARSAWITFLVDPAAEPSSRKKGQKVWAVALSPVKPIDRNSKEFVYVMALNSGWGEHLVSFFRELDNLRKN